MDDQRFGRALRRIRHGLRWRQQDVADRARVSRATYSTVERGHLDGVSVGMLRRVASALEVRLELVPRWRGADLDRMIAAGHARMHEQVAQALAAARWDVHSEVSFSHFGERGVVDIIAWNSGHRALLIVELKTEIVDVSDLLSTMDRRRRLAHQIVAPLRLEPVSVSRWVVVANTRTNRRRLADHRTVLRLAFPRDGRAISGWLRSPVGSIDALSFLTDDTPRSTRHAASGVQRVRARPSCTTSNGDRDIR